MSPGERRLGQARKQYLEELGKETREWMKGAVAGYFFEQPCGRQMVAVLRREVLQLEKHVGAYCGVAI